MKKSVIGRRSALLGGSAAALSMVAACAEMRMPIMGHSGQYHFKMPPGDRSLADIVRDLDPLLGGPVEVTNIADRNGNGRADVNEIVTVKARPRSSTASAISVAEKAQQTLMFDIEPDFEATGDQGNERSFCAPEREQPLAGNSDDCKSAGDEWNDFAWALRRMHVPEAWDYSKRLGRPAYGEGIVVGHIDTGVAQHVDVDTDAVLYSEAVNLVEPNLPGGVDPLTKMNHLIQPGHGTATASLIISRGDVGRVPPTGVCGGTIGPGRITGTAPMAKLLPIRAINFTATSNLVRIARAIDLLSKRRVGVITMALGWPIHSKLLRKSIKDAVANDIIVLAAAGNFFRTVVFPAAYPETIAIGATDPGNQPWCGSARGAEVVVCAPGQYVWRAIRSDEESRLDVIGQRYGTSFAVSQTAGIAALWLAHHGREQMIERLRVEKPGKTLQDAFRSALQRTAYKPPGWPSHGLGTGIVQADKLLELDAVAYA